MPEEDNNLLIGLNSSSASMPNQGGENSKFKVDDFGKLLVTLKKSWYWYILIFLIIGAATYVFNRYTVREYQSSSVLQLKFDSKIEDVGLQIGQVTGGANFENLSEEIELIKSQIIFRRVIEGLRLSDYYLQLGNVLNDERYNNSPFEVQPLVEDGFVYDKPFKVILRENEIEILDPLEQSQVITSFDKPFEIFGTEYKIVKTRFYSEEELGREFIYERKSVGKLVNELNSNIEVEILNGSAKTIRVAFRDDESQRAYDIVNAINSYYLELSLESKSRVQEQTIEFINSQLDSASRNLEEQEILLEDFIKKSGTADPGSQFSIVQGEIKELEERKIGIREQLTLVKQLSKLVDLADSVNTRLPVFNGFENGALLEEIRELNQEVSSFKTLSSSAKENTSVYKKAAIKLDQKRNAVQEGLLKYAEMLYKRSNELTKQIGYYQDEFFNLPSKNTQLKRIQRYYDLYEKYYLMLIEKRVEFGIAKAGALPQFVVLTPPVLSTIPIFPNTPLIYVGGLVFAFVICAFLLIVQFLLTDTIISQKELESGVNVPVLGVLPKYSKEKLDVSRLVVTKNPKSAISEAMRSIRTNLDFLSTKEKFKMSITSTISGEGKTFVSINLAGILAVSGKKVVLIDLDMRKPKVHLGFDLSNDIGMSSLLIGKSSIEEAIHKTSVENLDVITAGPTPPNPSELILRKEFDVLISELETVYDVILIDSPPVGLVTDGILVMKKVDVPLYVVRSGYSKRGVVDEINKISRSNRFKNLSVILNSVSTTGRYGYGYGYGYGYYE